jgi:DNA-binding beta-propeller fold protein YncE
MLFFVSGSIYKMGIHDQGFPAKSFINGSGHLFYGLGIDPDNNTLYAGDQNNFTQPGVVLQYSPSGKLLKTHKAGVGPNGFLFVK